MFRNPLKNWYYSYGESSEIPGIIPGCMGGATGRLAEVGGREVWFRAGAGLPVEVLVLFDMGTPDFTTESTQTLSN